MKAHKNQQPDFPSKLLLFGEYGILLGHQALAIPFPRFKNRLEFIAGKTDERWEGWLQYIEGINSSLYSKINISQLRYDVRRGLHFVGNIPENYGVGSSGALVAAVYRAYSEPDVVRKMDLSALRKDVSLLESYFHSQSSGIDPLVSLVQKPLFIKNDEVQVLETFALPENYQLFLLDSGQAGKTGGSVTKLLAKLEDALFLDAFHTAYSNYSDAAIQAVFKQDEDAMYESFVKLSEYQLNSMGELYPEHIYNLAIHGLTSNKYAIKLCGSGGGGFFLSVNNHNHQSLDASQFLVSNSELDKILVTF